MYDKNHKQQIIPVGRNPQARYCGYGDDSTCGETIVFALAVMGRDVVPKAEKCLLDIREKYQIPSNTPIHCRILFHEDARERAGLQHLDQDDVLGCFHEILFRMFQLHVLCRYSCTERPKSKFLAEPDDKFPLTVLSDDKILQGILAQACVHMGSEGPSVTDMECWYSEDKTPIKFNLEAPRRQAHKGYKGQSDIGVSPGTTHEFEPHISDWTKTPLLQLADVYAYLTSHAQEEIRTKTMGFFWNHLNYIYKSVATARFGF